MDHENTIAFPLPQEAGACSVKMGEVAAKYDNVTSIVPSCSVPCCPQAFYLNTKPITPSYWNVLFIVKLQEMFAKFCF